MPKIPPNCQGHSFKPPIHPPPPSNFLLQNLHFPVSPGSFLFSMFSPSIDLPSDAAPAGPLCCEAPWCSQGLGAFEGAILGIDMLVQEIP